MKKFLTTLLTLTFFCNITLAETLSFIHITDIHYPKQDIMGYEGRSFINAKQNLQRAIEAINNTEHKYVFITGDMVDQSFKEVFDEFFEALSSLNKVYYLALGNHDSNTPNGFTKKDTLEYLKNTTPHKPIEANYAIELNNKFMAIMLDGSSDTKINSRGYFPKETLKWFENIVSSNPDKYILVFQHFPIVEPAKDTSYFHKHTTRKKRRFTKILKKHPNIILVSSGHYHVSGEFEKYGCKHFSTPALFLTPSYYRLVEIEYEDNKINSIKTRLIEP